MYHIYKYIIYILYTSYIYCIIYIYICIYNIYIYYTYIYINVYIYIYIYIYLYIYMYYQIIFKQSKFLDLVLQVSCLLCNNRQPKKLWSYAIYNIVFFFMMMMMMSDLQYHKMQTAGKYLFLNTSLACLTLFYLSPDLL